MGLMQGKTLHIVVGIILLHRPLMKGEIWGHLETTITHRLGNYSNLVHASDRAFRECAQTNKSCIEEHPLNLGHVAARARSRRITVWRCCYMYLTVSPTGKDILFWL